MEHMNSTFANSSTLSPTTTSFVMIDRFRDTSWITALVEQVLSAVVLSWIIISITVYGIRNGKWKKENKLTSGNLSSRKIYMSAILAMLSNFFCVVVNVLSNNYSYNKPCDHCYALCKLYDFAIFFTNFSILLFLWLRQRSFYLHPSLSVLNQFLPIRLLNWTSLLLLTVGVAVPSVVWLAGDNYTSSNTFVCVLKSVTETDMRPVITGLVLSIICHCMLLGLVVYPLCKQADVRRKRIYRFIIRTTVTATVCIIGNCTALVLTHHLSKSSYRPVRVKTVITLNTLINVFSLVFSFEVWRDILTCTRCSREVTWEELSCDKLSRGGKFSTPCSCFCFIIWVEENVLISSRYKPKRVKHVVAQVICQKLWTVVCLRGGERGTCLGPPVFGDPPWGDTRVNLHDFVWKTCHSLI